MEGTLLDEQMKIIRSDPQLLTRSCEQLMNEMNAMENQQSIQGEVEEDSEGSEEETIEIDKKYNSMREVRLAAIEYGRRRKFAVSTLRSGARQLVLACKHSGTYRGTKKAIVEESDTTREPENSLPAIALQQVDDGATAIQKRTRRKVSRKIQCPFQIRAKPVKGDQWVIYKMSLEHNHPMATDSKAYAQHRKLDEETRNLIVRLMRSGSTNTMIVKYLSLKGIRNVVRKDIANLRQTHFNPKNNKINASGNILYQVEHMDNQEQHIDLQIDIQNIIQNAAQQHKNSEQQEETSTLPSQQQQQESTIHEVSTVSPSSPSEQKTQKEETVEEQAQRVVEAMKALHESENK
ncbi:hypothetical protein BD770DRAFT_473622 [Pilaira anomala]|nr:hypothetical protein BD770DRAFT_473622 [Pilaira anomala]